MHDVAIRLKNGEEFSGIILKNYIDSKNFEDSYIELFRHGDTKSIIVYVREIESAISKEDRISSSKLGDMDVIETMKFHYDNGFFDDKES